MYADKTISFDGDPSRENSFVCERVYLIFLLQHWSHCSLMKITTKTSASNSDL
jgi:hypothetical protein